MAPRKKTSAKPAGKRRASRSGKTGRGKSQGFLARWRRRLWQWAWRSTAILFGVILLVVLVFAFVNPPTTPYISAEKRRLGQVDRQWVDLEEISPHLVRAVVAGEDANFCLHWGFDMAEIRKALEGGGERGASTLTQQTVKNLFLWHGRSWPRKALEALITPVVELVWTKRRTVEVYLNVAEFGEGVFGAEAAARTNFRTGPDRLQLWQAARLAAVLPDPKGRSATRSSAFVERRARAIADGAETIRVDGRAGCLGSG